MKGWCALFQDIMYFNILYDLYKLIEEAYLYLSLGLQKYILLELDAELSKTY